MPGGPNQLVASYTPGAARQNFAGGVGFTFGLTASKTFNMIGCRCGSGALGPQNLRLFSVGQSPDLATATIDVTGGVTGQFYYVSIPPVTLAATTKYCLFAQVTSSNGYLWTDTGATVVAGGTNWQSVYANGSFATNNPSTSTQNQQFFGLDLDFVAPANFVDLAGNFAL